ncbi:uncharacterized protein DUF732 [Haloactinospora alba]|uniref:Uncharacterized protein DUF732 n=1 Tax=Haloactinospora alba TaxID=405555 RepID=A0A543NFP8_9ACTN|nr:DUF732 domain-containing protein [Haloactinospora alba]TQN30636.1 uncharacterized protein DUF732 [Haloactinospora alba]
MTSPQPGRPITQRWSAMSPAAKAWIIGIGIFLTLGAIGGLMEAAGILPEGPPPEHAAPDGEDSSEDDGISEDEQAFLDALYEDAKEQGSGIHGFGDEDNLELGYAVCSDLEDGMAPTEVVQSLQPDDGEDEETPISKVASPLVGHAQTYLCEEPSTEDTGKGDWPDDGHVTEAEFEEHDLTWPLTETEGELQCEIIDGPDVESVTITVDDTEYAVNGVADSRAEDIEPIWAVNQELLDEIEEAGEEAPDDFTPRVGIGDLIDTGLELCDEG